MKSLQETFGALIADIPREVRLSSQLKGVVSSKIVQRRMEKGMTQKQLAAHLGLKQPSLSKWENGEQNFTLEQICKICVLLDIDYRDIFRIRNMLDDEKTPEYYIQAPKTNSFIPEIRHDELLFAS